MEALAALGLASNVFQLIDFTSKLTVNTATLYRSTSKASGNSIVLEHIATTLIRLSDDIRILPGCSQGLEQLALQAKEVASDLVTLLEGLKIRTSKTKWKCFLSAAKEIWNQEKLKSITANISGLQSQISLLLQTQIK